MKRWAKIAVILLVLGVLGYGLYVQVLKWHKKTMEMSLEQESVAWQNESERLEQEIAELRERLVLKQEATLPEEKLQEIFGADAAVRVGEGGEAEREEVVVARRPVIRHHLPAHPLPWKLRRRMITFP